MKIIAVGMNYAEHNKELKETFTYTEPVLFTKPESALVREGKPFFIPDFASRFEYETEIVVRICRMGKDISERFAGRYYNEVSLGIDFTARDLQEKLREKGLPWDICKGFDGSAVVGDFIDKSEVGDMSDIHFRLDIDGQTVQSGWTGDMIFSIDRIVAHASKFFTLKMGDIIYTGTPAGVGPVSENNLFEGYIGDKKVLEFKAK